MPSPSSLTPVTMSARLFMWAAFVFVAAAHENQYARVRVASFAYVVFAVLQFLTALRYPVVDWQAPQGLLLAVLLLALFAIGSIGLRGNLKQRPLRVRQARR